MTLAPFQILASEGRAPALDRVARVAPRRARQAGGRPDHCRRATASSISSSREERDAATQWWLDLTATGGEGMVVKPAYLTEGRVQPGIKVRGREYLRIIYGPDYTDSLDVLRNRHLGKKRQLAQREHGLGTRSAHRVR
ncbi:MAG: hypothetical protein WKF73_01065 [Nocardioidaceae bacterium]